MGATQTTSNEQRLSVLFPGMDVSTIQNTLNEANGDTAKAIVLLIQTPSNSESPIPTNPYKNHNEFLENSKNRSKFIKQPFKSNRCNLFAYITSILFWICIALILIVIIILSSLNFLVDESFSFTLCFCAVIELIFTILILYGVISYKIWSIWVTLLWCTLHGITAIYSIIKWHDYSHYVLYYIGIVVIFWLSVIIFNIAYFIKLNRAESRFNSLISETKNALNKNNTTARTQKNNTLTPTSGIMYDSNAPLTTNKNENNDNCHEQKNTNSINVNELVDLAMDILNDMDSDNGSENDQHSNDGSVIIKLDAE